MIECSSTTLGKMTKSAKKKPELSVFVLTYNQEEYITQTLESILMQETNFNFEIVIGDDASTDNTSTICKEYQRRFPAQIDYHRNKTNIGLIANFVKTASRLKGTYVAILDGDDYWIDPQKLQKQVDFLEKNPEYSIVGTQSASLVDEVISTPDLEDGLKTYTFDEMVLYNRISAPTALFRNFKRLRALPSYFLGFPYGDWPVYLLLLYSTKNKAVQLPDVTAVYRKQIGVSASMRTNAFEVASKNYRILQNLIEDKQMSGANTQLKKGLIRHKKAQISALNRQAAYARALGELLVMLRQDFKCIHLKWYIYSLKTSLFK